MAEGLAVGVANSLLDALFNATNYTAPTGAWVQLHTAAPGAAGTTAVATESTRVQGSFSAGASGATSNDAELDWTDVAGTETYTHVSVWSAATAGTFLCSGTITANAVTAGDNFSLPVGDIDVSFTVAS